MTSGEGPVFHINDTAENAHHDGGKARVCLKSGSRQALLLKTASERELD